MGVGVSAGGGGVGVTASCFAHETFRRMANNAAKQGKRKINARYHEVRAELARYNRAMPLVHVAARVIRDLRAPAREADRTETLTFERLRQFLTRPVEALPLDLFRILIGLLSLAYFTRTLLEAPDYSNPRGLIDHDLVRTIFPFTAMGLFQPGMPLILFQSIFVLACLASMAVVAGWRVKLSAAVLYVIAVSTYRWNFLVMYVDDVLMHLMLFWLLLLPIGRTMILSEWRSRRSQAWEHWKTITVPGTAVRCFLWNLIVIYLVAGLWKWSSPMWRDGTALYAVLQLPIAWAPDFWRPEHLPFLKVLNAFALLLETLFPVLFLLPAGHRARYALLIALLGFHAGMILTLQIPFANIACMAAAVIVFREELMHLWSGSRRASMGRSGPRSTEAIGYSGAIAIAFVVILTLAMLSSVVLPEWRTPVREKAVTASDHEAFEGLRPLQKAFFAPLWIAGLAQQYQLFNWIDERNYTVRYDAGPVDPSEIVLRTTRGTLLQAYIHGISWMQIPHSRREQLRQSIYVRSAARYCRDVGNSSVISLQSTLRRTRSAEASRAVLMQFRCVHGEPVMQAMNLNP